MPVCILREKKMWTWMGGEVGRVREDLEVWNHYQNILYRNYSQ